MCNDSSMYDQTKERSKMKKTIVTSFLTVILVSSPIHAFAKQWVKSIKSVHGGSCTSFGKGWSDFAYDDKSKITFCKWITNKRPTYGVIDVKGFNPGNVNCASKFGKGWDNFAYDGKANMTFCVKKGNVNDSEDYVSDVNAFEGKDACDGQFAGRGWDRVIYNGHSGITFCAQFQ